MKSAEPNVARDAFLIFCFGLNVTCFFNEDNKYTYNNLNLEFYHGHRYGDWVK